MRTYILGAALFAVAAFGVYTSVATADPNEPPDHFDTNSWTQGEDYTGPLFPEMAVYDSEGFFTGFISDSYEPGTTMDAQSVPGANGSTIISLPNQKIRLNQFSVFECECNDGCSDSTCKIVYTKYQNGSISTPKCEGSCTLDGSPPVTTQTGGEGGTGGNGFPDFPSGGSDGQPQTAQEWYDKKEECETRMCLKKTSYESQ